MSEITPRINAPLLAQFVGHTVRIVGRVTGIQGDNATIDAQGNISLHLTRDDHLVYNNGVELIGKINPDMSVKVLTSWDLGPDVDYKVSEAVVDVTHRYKELFYEG
ncbi:replication factor A protein 3 [Ascodesmis nigricans]|uniref:Replication factor A protein 3 n=1 Tax=Ascodesmis nigricans TaxID=341454 RepID=A0A4S2N615_9PEZI|nr:replication factor A protein 3 [Ascodesmis nigricans]